MNDIKETRYDNGVIVLEKGLCGIMVCTNNIRTLRKAIKDARKGSRFMMKGLDCDVQTYISEMTRLTDLADRIARHDDLDVFSYLPTTKAGTFAKNKNILLADTKCSQTYNGEYFSKKSLQLRLEWPWYVPDYVRQAVDTDNLMILQVAMYDASKKMEPIFDEHGNPHIVARTKASYLKPDSLVPGHVYREKTGTEYLYLGILPVKTELFLAKDGEYPDGVVPSEGDVCDFSKSYAHIRWTAKLRDAIGAPKDLTDFLTAYTDIVPEWRDKVSLRAKPRSFTEEVCEVFDGTVVHPATLRTPNKPENWGGYSYSFLQYYIG